MSDVRGTGMSRKALATDMAFYGMLYILLRGFNMLLIPIYTRVLSQGQYGDLDLIHTGAGFVFTLLDLQFIHGFSRFYPKYKKEGRHKEFVGTMLMTPLLYASLGAATFIGLGEAGLLEFSFMPSYTAYRTSWIAVMIAVPLHQVMDLLLMHSRMERSKRWYGAGALGHTISTGVFCILFVVVFRMEVFGVILGQLIGRAVGVLIAWYGMRKQIAWVWQKDVFRTALAYTLPMVPGWWLGFSSSYVNRFLLYGKMGAEDVAVFALAAKGIILISLLNFAFQLAWQPLAMGYIGEKGSTKFYVQSMRIYLSGSLFGLFALSAIAHILIKILAPDTYADAAAYLPLLAVGAVLSGVATNLQLGNQIAKKTGWMSVTSGASLVVNLLVLITLIPLVGVWGAVIGMIAAGCIQWIIAYLSSRRSYAIPYDWRAFGIFFGGIVVALMMILWLQEQIPRFVYMPLAVIIGMVLAWFVFSSAERQAVVSKARALLKRN